MELLRSDTLTAAPVAPRGGVYFAVVDGEGVIMDIVANRYYGLTGQATEMWQRLVATDVSRSGQRSSECSSFESGPVLMEALNAWRASNLIGCAREPQAAEYLPVAKDPREPAKFGIPGKDIRGASRSLVILGALVRETLRTKRSITRKGLAVTLQSVQKIDAHDAVSSRRGELLSILHTYYMSRVPLSQGTDDCLQRSLALTSLLRRRGIDAEICFGVEKFPFRAHAWVEASGLVLNETPNGIRRYTVVGRF